LLTYITYVFNIRPRITATVHNVYIIIVHEITLQSTCKIFLAGRLVLPPF